jgi:hypothetical protein
VDPDPRRPTHEPSQRARDERAAATARRRLRAAGVIPIEPDERIGVLLNAEERVLAMRADVAVGCLDDPDKREPSAGSLYLTTERLLVLGAPSVELALSDIHEAEVLDRQILLRSRDGAALSIGVADAELLRMEIGAARAAVREARGGQGSR